LLGDFLWGKSIMKNDAAAKKPVFLQPVQKATG